MLTYTQLKESNLDTLMHFNFLMSVSQQLDPTTKQEVGKMILAYLSDAEFMADIQTALNLQQAANQAQQNPANQLQVVQ